MPRTGRILVSGFPHHIVQRGHNKQVVFADPSDFIFYLSNLKELKQEFDVQVFSYCLMTNHVHLLLYADNNPSNISKLMKALSARMTRYRNKLEKRTGTLWESRYKSSPVQTEQYLLACCRYIELNPVRAFMVPTPKDYPWSSYCQRVDPEDYNQWIDLDPMYLNLGNNSKSRIQSYKEFVSQAVASNEIQFFRETLQRGQLTGNNRFVREVEQITGQRIEFRPRGRPCTDK